YVNASTTCASLHHHNSLTSFLLHAPPTTEIYTLSLHDALPISEDAEAAVRPENVIPRVASHLRMIGERDDWAPIWISLYKANALDRKSTRLNSSHVKISYAVFCLKKKKKYKKHY